MRYVKSAIIFLLINYSTLLTSQITNFSREFASYRSHVPIQIINNNQNSFYVLRYNKQIHDLTVERRKKSNFEIINFTPLKLDSVNVSWFDYENLNFLFFEENFKVYFVFEKALNTKKVIFIKSIDSTGLSTGFKELASIEKDKTMIDFKFEFKRANPSSLLIVGEHYYHNTTAKKTVLVYDLVKNTNSSVIKLPIENTSTGFSQSYECENGRLYYLLINAYLYKQKRVYASNQQSLVPVYYKKVMQINCFNLQLKQIKQANLSMNHYAEIKNIKINTLNNQATVLMQFVDDYDSTKKKFCLLSQAFNQDLSAELFNKIVPINEDVENELTFFDAGDEDKVIEKDFEFYQSKSIGASLFCMSQRKETNYAKELFIWKTDLENGEITNQKVLPRKIFYFDDRTRYKNIAEVAVIQKNNQPAFLLLENKRNEKLNPNYFNFHLFKKQKYITGANLVAYSLDETNQLSREIIFRSDNFLFVPLKYNTNQNEFIFYMNKGKKEKFAILKL